MHRFCTSDFFQGTPLRSKTLRLSGQSVCVVYGDWQMFLPTESSTSRVIFLRQTACHGLEPPVKPPAKPAPKAAKPRAKHSAKSSAKPAAQVAAKPADQHAAGEPIPVAPVEHVQLFRVKYSCQKRGTQSLFLSRAEHASQQAVPGSFCCSYAFVYARLVSCRASFAF